MTENAVANRKQGFAVYCPCCNRKLMLINKPAYKAPVVHPLTEHTEQADDVEIRCGRCKAYVGIQLT